MTLEHLKLKYFSFMKIVVQRVKHSSVTVDGNVSGKIDKGLLLLVGIHESDTKQTIDWCCKKVSKLRIFEDKNGKMNLSVRDINGEILVVSQFTLYGNTKKGTRPSFIEAAKPEVAEPLYDYMVEKLKSINDLNIESGEFGAMMEVDLLNDGPVTIIVEK